jgi:hypothetical protein
LGGTAEPPELKTYKDARYVRQRIDYSIKSRCLLEARLGASQTARDGRPAVNRRMPGSAARDHYILAAAVTMAGRAHVFSKLPQQWEFCRDGRR